MSLIKDFSPQRTRKKRDEPRGSNTKLEEVRLGPVEKIKQQEERNKTSEMIDQYQYHPDQDQTKQKIISEQLPEVSKPLTPEKFSNQCPPFGLYELIPMCEEHLLNYLYGTQDMKFKKIYELERGFIKTKHEIMAEHKIEITFESFKDELYYYKGEVFITEDYLELTGFLREYFQIEKVAVLYNTGEILLIETGYCSFWFKDRLAKFFNGGLRELSHTEIKNDDNCLDCIFNWNCPFSRVQQMPK